MVLHSQVPQPTCYWKWVGVSIPQKVGNFSLRPSSTDIWQHSRLRGCLLSSYGSWLSQTPTLNFHISPSAAVAGHLCHPPNPHFAPSQSSFRYCCVYTTVFLTSTFHISFHGILFSFADQCMVQCLLKSRRRGGEARALRVYSNQARILCSCLLWARGLSPFRCR